jgi:DeoR family ulaG and ulaABCDEF operon transcriptional repressor
MDNNHDRRRRLLELLAELGSASVFQLATRLGVSGATVRRDLRLLHALGQLKRVHGGGTRADVRRTGPLEGDTFHNGTPRHAERKRAIARYAASMLQDSDTVLIGGGSTTCGMTEFLSERRMRILTNSFEVARRLLATSDNEVILGGGRIYAAQGIIFSPFDSEVIQYCYADKLFMGTHSLSTLGLMEADPLSIQAGRRLIGQAPQVIVLADSSKFGNRGGMFLCGLDRISCVVTDSDAPDAAVQALERAGISVKLVVPRPLPHEDEPAGMALAPFYSRSPRSPSTPH